MHPQDEECVFNNRPGQLCTRHAQFEERRRTRLDSHLQRNVILTTESSVGYPRVFQSQGRAAIVVD